MAELPRCQLRVAISLLGLLLILGGSLSVLGHMLGWPVLYNWRHNIGMALNTGVLFIAAGAGLLGLNALCANWRDDHETD